MAKGSAKKPSLPSEAEILGFIAENPGKTGKREIGRAFQVKGAARIELKRLLKRMTNDGLIQKHRRTLSAPGRLPPVAVVVVKDVGPDGEPLCEPEAWHDEQDGPAPHIVLVSTGRASATASPGPGARLLARLTRVSKGAGDPNRYEARTIRVLENSAQRMIGVIRKSAQGEVRIEPVEKRERREFVIDADQLPEHPDGRLVEAELTRGRRPGLWRARVVEDHGPVTGRHAASLIAIAQHDLPHIFPEAALSEAGRARPAQLADRIDMRDVPLVTIDPADARDRDDAVWATGDKDEKNAGGHRVIVAIADVAHYVTPGSALDVEAHNRGNSVYFPDQVVPMLPERLSNELCSLSPGQDRAALVAEMVFDKNGRKLEHRFHRALIKTAAALSYAQFQSAIDGKPDKTTRALVDPVLGPVWRAYKALAKARDKRQPLSLDLPERKIEIGGDGHISRIFVPERLEAHKLIEEFMIQANVAAAQTLERARYGLIYRVHETPPLGKLDPLADFLATLGIKFARGQVKQPSAFNAVLKQARGKPVEALVHQMVLRSQTQAVYSPENLAHFGLNLARYAHFTSPIRRYADLMVHRALIAELGDKSTVPDEKQLADIAEHISITERRAMAAERDTTDRLIAAFLAERTGASFNAVISGMTRGALFVELDEIGADGIIPVSGLSRDYFRYNERSQTMSGEKTGETYRLGDKVEVRLLEAAPVSGGLRFEMVSPGTTSTRARKRPAGKSRTRARRR